MVLYKQLEAIIAQQYCPERELKRSERGELLLLRHRESGRRMVCRRYSGSVDAYRRMQDIRCPHLPRVEACAEEDGRVLVLEEYIQGDRLDFLLEGGALSEHDSRHIARQLCVALQALHERGIVHRDVKPENIIIRGDEAVLIDFDVARIYKTEVVSDTQVMGTTGYAAPEQFGFSQTDARADFYAMGVLLNQMLTLRHPASCLAEGPLRPVIEKCIEVNVDKRYRSAKELLLALDEKRTRRRRVFLWLAGAVLLAGAVTLALGRPFSGEANAPESAVTETYAPEETEEPAPANPYAEIIWLSTVKPDEDHAYTEFTCDMDGDGTEERYIFCICASSDGENAAPVPADAMRRETSGQVYMAPVVLRVVDGGYEFAEEFAPLLQDTSVDMNMENDVLSGEPTVLRADPLNHRWSSTRLIVYGDDCAGTWHYKGCGTFDGWFLTATCAAQVNLPEGEAEG